MTTDIEPQDELDVPHLKERLRHELLALHAERGRSPSAPEGVASPARRGRRRSLVASAAAAALVVGLVATHRAGTGSDGSMTAAPPDAPLMERVVAATDLALADSVVHIVDRQVLPDGGAIVLEIWADETSQASRLLERNARGEPMVDVGPLVGPTVESPSHPGQRAVYHCIQQYTEIADTGSASTDIEGGTFSPQQLRDDVATGRLVEGGTEVVDGRELIRLVTSDGNVVLVDPDSHRAVGLRGTFAGVGGTYDQTVEYLPRTPENLARITPPVPDGFARVDPEGDDFTPGSCFAQGAVQGVR